MIKHIVSFNFIDGIADSKKREISIQFKTRIEKLKDIIEGINIINVVIDTLPTSNKEILLYSEFISEYALKEYQDHPFHQAIIKDFGSKYFKDRACIDYKF